MIKTKSIYKPKQYGDGTRILITRFYPRGVKKDHFDKWIRDLAPSADLLQRYKNNNIEWNEFVVKFKHELQNDTSLHIINKLHSNKRNITLLCYEPDGIPCHRHLLRDIIDDPDLLFVDFRSEYADNHKRILVAK